MIRRVTSSLTARCVLLVLLLAGCGWTLRAQVDSASLTGLITDPSQAAVRGATVSVVNATNGVERSTTSDDAGYYNFPSLPIGAYTVTVTQAGFSKQSEQVTLDPSAKTRRDFQLAVGAESTSVQVQAEAPQLSRDDASIGTVIDNQTIVSTPLFQRNWDDLIRLVPGIQQNRHTQQSGATDSGRTGDCHSRTSGWGISVRLPRSRME